MAILASQAEALRHLILLQASFADALNFSAVLGLLGPKIDKSPVGASEAAQQQFYQYKPSSFQQHQEDCFLAVATIARRHLYLEGVERPQSRDWILGAFSFSRRRSDDVTTDCAFPHEGYPWITGCHSRRVEREDICAGCAC